MSMVERHRIVKERRTYRLRKRAESMDRTRARITGAAVDLHGSVGPRATTMTAVAERAGVTRATLYRHFPTEAALVAACSAEWRTANPSPDPSAWSLIRDPHERVATALAALYGWYRTGESMRANLLRDLDVLPDPIRVGITSYPISIGATLDDGWPEPSRQRLAAIGHAVAFETWRSLTREGLTDSEAARLMTELVRRAAEVS